MSTDLPAPAMTAETWMAALKDLGVCKVEILLLDEPKRERTAAGMYPLGAVDVTYYFDQPATADQSHPFSSREFQGVTGETLRTFERWLQTGA